MVSVVTVVDFTYHEDRADDSLEATLTALARQDFEGPVEFLFCESSEQPSRMTPELRARLPGVKVLTFPFTASYELMNAGAHAASADIVGFVDGDCAPCPGWIRYLLESFGDHPEVAGVSGLTKYATNSFRDRVFALLSRSYLNPGGAGPTRFFCNNNGGMRRDVWVRHPLPTDAGPYGSRLQTEAIWRDGGRFIFDPRMEVVHDYEGWDMEKDIRRHHGFSTVSTRLRDRKIPHAWLVNLGPPAIPFLAAAKMLATWGDCLRCARAYKVRWHEVPAALGLATVLHALEIPGMMTAYRGQSIDNTRYS